MPPERDADDDDDGPKGVPRRGPISDHLERDTEEHPVDASKVECCGTPLLEARDPRVLERKTLVPAHVRVRRIELHWSHCLCCKTVHTAATPPLAMPNASLAAALIAYIVHGTCGLHLPLKRLVEELSTKGLAMAKSTMSNITRQRCSSRSMTES